MRDLVTLRRSNLRSLIDSKYHGSQAELVDKIGINQGELSGLLKSKSFGEKKARSLEGLIGIADGWFDIDHSMTENQNNESVHIESSLVVSHSSIQIPVLSNNGSMGHGCELEDGDIVISSLCVQREWIDKHLPNTKPMNLRFIHGMGDSMSPTYNDGDILLVDTGLTSTDVDGIYTMVANGQMFIKRVTRKMDGTLVVTSDNPSVKTSDSLNGDHTVEVKGRVVWAWNGKRL